MGILDKCIIKTCDVVDIDPISYCNIEKIDKTCSIVDLIDDQQCIGAAITVLNTNFDNLKYNLIIKYKIQ